ncbi:MAG: toll/interleukin-1 receptor domain-containing protein [Chitinophagaceae bacterium]|nr:toll/interleukin-1 receptor domain-containing protein [Chitinophagaceae bacterium]
MEAQKVFLSYSRADSEFALKLATDLRTAGANIWIDQLDIAAGDIWDLEIEKALAACQSIMAILSCSSVASNNVLNEIYYALEEGKKVLPIIIDECKIPFRIKRLQHIDVRKNYDQGLNRILQALNLSQKSNDANSSIPSPPKLIEDTIRLEESAWQQVQKEESLSSYRNYIKNFPQGRFLQEAAEAINELKKRDSGNITNRADENNQAVQEQGYDKYDARPRKKFSTSWIFIIAGIAIIAMIAFFVYNKTPEISIQREMIFTMSACDTLDSKDKIACLTQLAEKGNDSAMLRIASIHERGDGTAVDDSMAFKWYSKAAEAGNFTAMYTVGDFYLSGRAGSKNDTSQALIWFTKAAGQGSVDAAERVKQLQPKLVSDSGKLAQSTDSTTLVKNIVKNDTVGVIKPEKLKEPGNTEETTTDKSPESIKPWIVSGERKAQVNFGNEFDFETGRQTGVNSDFYFKGNLILLRKHNSSFSIINNKQFDEINIPYLANLVYSRDIISEQQLTTGTIIAVKTHEGGYAKFRIDASGRPFRITWVTYQKRRKIG